MKAKPLSFAIAMTFLGLMATVPVLFNLSVVSQQGEQNGFDKAVREVGGIKKGKVSYLSFSNKLNPKLSAAVNRQFQEIIDPELTPSGKTYSYAEIDINGDGKKDAFVQLNDSLGSGTGGNHTWIFQAKNNGYEIISVILHQVSLVILPTKKSGWNDILIVPGKLWSPVGTFYQVCSYSPTQKWDRNDFTSSPNNYRNCSKIQRGSVVSGAVIDTGFTSKNPDFDLSAPKP